MMAEKPTYEELEQRVLELENETEKRKQAEEVLHQYGHIVSSSTDMMALLDKRFSYLAANRAYLEAFELTSKQLIGNTVINLFGEEFFNTVVKPNADRCLGGEEINYQDWFDYQAFERRFMDITYSPYYSEDKKIIGFVVNGRNITERKLAEDELLQEKEKLQESLHNIRALSGLLSICASCKKIRDDKGYWNQIESYVRDHSEAEFSHGICPECTKKLYPELALYRENNNE